MTNSQSRIKLPLPPLKKKSLKIAPLSEQYTQLFMALYFYVYKIGGKLIKLEIQNLP